MATPTETSAANQRMLDWHLTSKHQEEVVGSPIIYVLPASVILVCGGGGLFLWWLNSSETASLIIRELLK